MTRNTLKTCAATVLAASALLAACGADSNDTSGQDAGSVELEMLAHITPTLTREYWEDLAGLYEAENPDVTVKLVDTGTLSVGEAIKPLIASGNVPDVVYGYPPTETNYDLLLPLTDEPWLADTVPLPESWKIDGESYIAPVSFQVQSLVFYNKQMFEDAGITELPQSIQDLTTAMEKLQTAGHMPFQPAGKQLMGSQILMLSYPSIFGDNPTWYADVNTGEETIADSGMGDVVRAYAEWVQNGFINEQAITTDYGKTQSDFINGTGALYPMGSWFAASVGDKADQFGVFPAPVADGSSKPPPVATGIGGWVVFNDTEVADAAVDFVRFVTTDPAAVELQLAADGNFAPDVTYEQNSLQVEIQDIIDSAPNLTDCCGGSGVINVAPGGLGGELATIAQGIVGGTSGEDAAQQVQDFWDQNRPGG